MNQHPTDEELALFVEDKLPKSKKREVIEHIKECYECAMCVSGAVKERRRSKIYYILPLAATILGIIFIPILDDNSKNEIISKGIGDIDKISIFEYIINWIKELIGK